jgi:hypothetical protein
VNRPAATDGPVKDGAGKGLKGAIFPTSKWQISGMTGTRLLHLDSGRFGHGPMHISVDGQRILTFAKPSRARPWLVSHEVGVDGRAVAIYAETTDYGDTIHCDVFVGGLSLSGGPPLSAISTRGEDAEASSSSFVSPLDALRLSKQAIQQSAWILPASIGARLFVTSAGRSTIVVSVLFVLYCLLVWAVALMGIRATARFRDDTHFRRLKAIATPTICLATEVLLGVILLGVVTAVA